ncbi:MAG: DUF1838 family protein [Pseudomonadota bacterium]
MIARTLLVATGAALMSACATAAPARLDLETAPDTLTAMRKIMCSTIDEKPVTYAWHGAAYSRKQGEKDKLLFNVEGMNIRQCTRVEDETRGVGYKLVSRELLIYVDPETNEALATWDNPWTGETVDVLHVANDPVNFTAYETGRDGSPATFRGSIQGDKWWMTNTVPLWYPNVLGGEYQAEVGGVYHATEMFNFFGDMEDLTDPELDTASVWVGWSRMSDWLPWMKMSGREGVIYMHTAGRKLDAFEDMSDLLKSEIETHYPGYASPPPANDDRRNETSWIYYQRVRDGERVAPDRGGAAVE